MFTSFTVFLDACVLVPNWLRDVLLTAAQFELYRPCWSPTVLSETRNTLINKIGVAPENADYTLNMVCTAFPEALVTGYEPFIAGMPVNDKDKHVVAATLIGRAELIVTNNLADFPQGLLAPIGLKAKSADTFLSDLLARYPKEILGVLNFMAENTGKAGKPELTLYDVVQAIGASAPNFAAAALFAFDIT